MLTTVDSLICKVLASWFVSAGVAKLAYAADSKTPANGDSTTSKTYRNLPKISFKPTTGADFSPNKPTDLGEI